MKFLNATDAATLSADLRQVPLEDFALLDGLPNVISGWRCSSELQPFRFQQAWWFEDLPDYQVSGLPPAEVNAEVEQVSAYFQVSVAGLPRVTH